MSRYNCDNMPYSISTYCLHNLPLTEALDKLVPCTQHVEIMSDELSLFHKTKIYASYNFKYSIHAPMSINNSFVNLAASDEKLRCQSVNAITSTFEIAADMSAPVVVHPGFYDEENPIGNNYQLSLAEIKNSAEDYGVTYFYENLAPGMNALLTSPKDREIHGESLFCLDIGHANVSRNLSQFLDLPFSHIHLHDNDGLTDTHDPAGEALK